MIINIILSNPMKCYILMGLIIAFILLKINEYKNDIWGIKDDAIGMFIILVTIFWASILPVTILLLIIIGINHIVHKYLTKEIKLFQKKK